MTVGLCTPDGIRTLSLEYPERALLVAEQVDPGNVDAYAVGRVDADRGPQEVLAGRDHAVNLRTARCRLVTEETGTKGGRRYGTYRRPGAGDTENGGPGVLRLVPRYARGAGARNLGYPLGHQTDIRPVAQRI